MSCHTHLAISDANHNIQSSILAINQLEVFVLHKGTLKKRSIIKGACCSLWTIETSEQSDLVLLSGQAAADHICLQCRPAAQVHRLVIPGQPGLTLPVHHQHKGYHGPPWPTHTHRGSFKSTEMWLHSIVIVTIVTMNKTSKMSWIVGGAPEVTKNLLTCVHKYFSKIKNVIIDMFHINVVSFNNTNED